MSDRERLWRRALEGTCVGGAAPGRFVPCVIPVTYLESSWVSASAVFLLVVTIGLWRHYLLSDGRRRRLEEQQHESLFLNNLEAVASLGPDGVIRRVNPAFATLFGRPATALTDRSFVELVAPQENARIVAVLEGATEGVRRTIEATIWQKAGEQAEVELTTVPIVVDGSTHGAYAIVRDITDRRRLERELEDRALHDYLTSLPNRALFTDRLRHALHRIRRDGGCVALLYVDLDRFKPVNDRAGHAGGDEVLRGVAGRLCSVIRDGDTVARVGGDEF
ncbi:MAG: diguanylate cyclase domain-containing protein, partial [Gemmatimonadota bacterium]